MNQIAIATAGFSIIATILLFFQNRAEEIIAKIFAQILLAVLIVIQFVHMLYLSGFLADINLISFFYLLSLGVVGPLFYLYSQYLIQTSKQWSKQELWHFLPAISSDSLLPGQTPAHDAK